MLSTESQLDVGIQICAAARRLAPPPDLAAFDRLAKLASEVAGGERIPRKQLDDVSKSSKSDVTGLRVAKLTVRAALNHLYAAPSARNTAGTCVENAASALARHLAGVDPGATSEFLALVDDAIVRRELAAQLAERRFSPTSPLAHVVSRPLAAASSRWASCSRRSPTEATASTSSSSRSGSGTKVTARPCSTVPDVFMEPVIHDLDGS